MYRAMRNDYATGAVGHVKYRKEYIPDIDKGSPIGPLFWHSSLFYKSPARLFRRKDKREERKEKVAFLPLVEKR